MVLAGRQRVHEDAPRNDGYTPAEAKAVITDVWDEVIDAMKGMSYGNR